MVPIDYVPSDHCYDGTWNNHKNWTARRILGLNGHAKINKLEEKNINLQ